MSSELLLLMKFVHLKNGGISKDMGGNGDYLVRVRAQVMTRDDSSGGWVPLGGGGLSNVSLRKRRIKQQQQQHTTSEVEQRSDLTLALALQYDCIIKRDFEYNKVMPTFHHWKTGERKFGLTFQAAADARAFDKGVCTALAELIEGMHGTTSPLQLQNTDVDDDDVFMTLNLPVERGDSRSSSDSSARGGNNSCHPTPPSELSQPQFSSHPHHHLHRISYLPRHPNNGSSNGSSDNEKGGSMQSWPRSTLVQEGKGVSPDKEPAEGCLPVGTDNYSYVQLTAMHEYTYPMMEDRQKVLQGMRRESGESFKKGGSSAQQPPLPMKISGHMGSSSRKARCKYCQEVFTVELNRRGACDFAPDKMRNLMDRVSCMQAAQGMTYHCMSDSEGDFVQRPCQCGSPGDEGCARRWFSLGILSLLVPCLCLYPPLRACHWCCVSCGACGGRHVAADQ
ncbi:hypothetical protein B566_EDAN008240 [Ephemera danica]|nr:hypothetical protein B566_EDAN008240 [Ephemera danica]